VTGGRKLSWVEVDAQAMRNNIAQFRRILGPDRTIMSVVKAGAYGHGLIPTAKTVVSAGAGWLGVFDVDEAITLRENGVDVPILILGDIYGEALDEAVERGFRITVPSCDMASRIVKKAQGLGRRADVHLKLETGTNRQGLLLSELESAIRILSEGKNIYMEGAYTHFANIEDTTDHSYAFFQLRQFRLALETMSGLGIKPPIRHTACSAATILFPETFFEMARVGVAMYGLWPSKETRVSSSQRGEMAVDLHPALTWKTRVVQVKDVSEGAFVGYGCSFKATRPMKIAVLPVGYYNGYDRKFGNSGYVLIRGRRAPVAGRVCMNLTMVNVTDIDGVSAGDETVLLGSQGDDSITAEQLAALSGTINYEIVARLDPAAPRILIE
jgi:alanine racemase